MSRSALLAITFMITKHWVLNDVLAVGILIDALALIALPCFPYGVLMMVDLLMVYCWLLYSPVSPCVSGDNACL